MTLTELFAAIAAAIRAKDGTTASIPATTFPERIMALSGGGGGGGDGFHYLVNVPVNLSASAAVTAEVYKEYTHALYNDVRLPIIPKDVLESYPYAFIVRFSAGTYHLFLGHGRPYYTGRKIVIPASSRARYDVNGDAWVLYSEYTSSTTISNTATTIWSNFDILRNDGTTVYFEASDPVPTD